LPNTFNITQNLREFINKLYLESKNVSYDAGGWKLTIPKVVQQTNTSDCGVFVCQLARSVVCNYKLDQNIKDVRQRMRAEILKGSLLFL